MSTVLVSTRVSRLNPGAAFAASLPELISWRIPAAPWRLMRFWAARRRQRSALRELAEIEYLLVDIGVTRAQALREAAKLFW